MRALLVVIVLANLARAQNDPRLLQAQRHADRSAELQSVGQYEAAAAAFAEAVKQVEAVRGPEHPKVAELWITLGNLYLTAALYDRAEPLFRRALATMEKLRGPDSDELLYSLGSLGGLYTSMGAYDAAQPVYTRALAIAEARQPGSLSVANLEAALGFLAVQHGDYDGAEARYRRGLQICEAKAPKGAERVSMLDGLAGVAHARGDFDRARPLFERVVAMRTAMNGAEHPITALGENNLAALLATIGQLEQAEALSRRSLAVTAKKLGTAHPQYGNLVTTLTFILGARGRVADAVSLLRNAAASAEQVLRNARLTSTEARMSSFLKLYAFHEQTAYSLWAAWPDRAETRKLALTLALMRKGRSVDEAADLTRLVQHDLGPEEQTSYERLRALRSELASRVFAGPGDAKATDHAARLKQLESQAEAIEQELALKSAPLKARSVLPNVEDVLARVAAALPKDGAYIELIAFQPTDYKATRDDPRVGAARYGALVLLPDGQVRAADLGPAAVIDEAIEKLLATVRRPAPSFDLGPAQALDKLVLAPIVPLLEGRTQLVLAPDGQLNLVPFAVLHDGTRFLADRYALSVVGSGRDLLRVSGTPAAGVTVIADPAFVAKRGSAPASRAGGLLPAKIDSLPGTRKEGQAIKKLLPRANLVLGAAASEPALLALAPQGILHIATHGVFLADLKPAPASARGLKVVAGSAAAPEGPKHPLLRSALLLSNAGVAGPGGSDGLVTALEIAGMNLWGTELVVLSACDTGRGDVQMGQGVYGLRRALQIAGAETVVTSLWRVDDDATRELMTRFYAALGRGAGRGQGLREAAAEVRKSRPHPYYWAPFVLIGRSDALRGGR